MAQIQEKVKNGKIASFKVKVFLGRDEAGKQIFRCKTWKPPAEKSIKHHYNIFGLIFGYAEKRNEVPLHIPSFEKG